MEFQKNRTNELNQEVLTYWVKLHSKQYDMDEPYPVPLFTDQIVFKSKFVPTREMAERHAYIQGYWPEDWEVIEWGIVNPGNPDGGDDEF